MRSSGILLHISSLPSPYGIGTLGKWAYEFVDFLKEAGQSYWQTLPFGPTGFGNSPYQTLSSFAGNPYFIDLSCLIEEGLLQKADLRKISWGKDPSKVDYKAIASLRFTVLQKAYQNFVMSPPKGYVSFLNEQKAWLEDYSLFMTLKELHGQRSWLTWEERYRVRKADALEELYETHGDRIRFWTVLQYFFFQQWGELKAYANKQNVSMIGDLPFYVAMDSADVWAQPELFALDQSRRPALVAGVPPDAFSENGQLWGTPLYDWEAMKQDGYEWWIRRLRHMKELEDVIRVDHFIGFSNYYAIPAEDHNAKGGRWMTGPGIAVLRAAEEKLGPLPILAENLGVLTPQSRKLLSYMQYPSMKVLQFGFDGDDSEYLPHNYPENSTAYLGTHDNNTFLGWLQNLPENTLRYVSDYLRCRPGEGMVWAGISALMASHARQVIVQMQDLLELDSKARMNIPSSISGNWEWRMEKAALSETLAKKIYRLTSLYHRWGF